FARRLSAGLLGFLLFGFSIAQAGPLYTVTVGDGPDNYPTITKQGATAVEATLNSSIPITDASTTKNEFAAAGPSGLRASARVTESASFSGKFPALAGASDIGLADAKIQLDDLRFRAGLDDRSAAIASLNLDLSGTFLTNVNAFFDPGGDPPIYFASARASALVALNVIVPDVNFNGSPQAQQFAFFQSTDTFGNFTGSLFDSGTITTQPFLFHAGLNRLTLELFIRVQGDAGGFSTSFDAISDSLVDFSHTVTFATHGPVFNLPDGYSANSDEAQITDNRFVSSTVAPAGVPEPASLTILAIGALELMGYSWWRRKQNCLYPGPR
ncbi:MAG: PEP-CTERM sorting domain-containing protein, partial [Gemmataceae bacterium]